MLHAPMSRRSFAVLVTLVAFVGAVISESPLHDKDPMETEVSAALDENCYNLTSKTNKFRDPKFYWGILKDLFGKETETADRAVRFYLFKKQFRDCGKAVSEDDYSLSKSGFNASHPTRFLIHGWMSQSNGEFCRSVKDAYLKIGDFNVLVVDWSVIAHTINYFKAAKLVEDVGEEVANFAKHLKTALNVDYNDIYLIGHSLGAHIAGSAGKRIQPDKFNTIFALDPAGPAFRGKPLDSVIDATDAKYVESIQTSRILGISEPVGHATFFTNKAKYKDCILACAHRRAYRYFAESITSDRGFWGAKCYEGKDKVWRCPRRGGDYKMGGEPSQPKNGMFYVKTNSSPPYARGKL